MPSPASVAGDLAAVDVQDLPGDERRRLQEKDAVVAQFAGRQFSEFKAALTETAVAKLGPIGSEMQRLMKDPGHVDKVLHEGAEKARALAEPILAETYKIVGFLKP